MNSSQSHSFIPILRAAARWGWSIADIAGWAATERLPIVMGICPVCCGPEPVAGVVEVATADILSLFLQETTENAGAYLKRIRRIGQDRDWLTITDPAEGVFVCLRDLAIQGHAAARFEAEEGLVMVRAGGALRYDWEKMAYGLFIRATQEGAPKSMSELVRWALDWFADQGEVPDESTARRRLTPLWRELQGQG